MKIWICKRNTLHKHCKRKWFLKSDYPWVKSDKETDRFMMNSCTMILWVYIITTWSPFCPCLSVLTCHDAQAPIHWHTIRQASYFTATARLLYIKAALPVSNSVISGSPGREFRTCRLVSTVVRADHVISKLLLSISPWYIYKLSWKWPLTSPNIFWRLFMFLCIFPRSFHVAFLSNSHFHTNYFVLSCSKDVVSTLSNSK